MKLVAYDDESELSFDLKDVPILHHADQEQGEERQSKAKEHLLPNGQPGDMQRPRHLIYPIRGGSAAKLLYVTALALTTAVLVLTRNVFWPLASRSIRLIQRCDLGADFGAKLALVAADHVPQKRAAASP